MPGFQAKQHRALLGLSRHVPADGIGRAAGGNGVEASVLPACTHLGCPLHPTDMPCGGDQGAQAPETSGRPLAPPAVTVLMIYTGPCIEALAAHRS